MPRVEEIPVGHDAPNVRPGDFILCHRKGFVSWCIRTGEHIKCQRGAIVSHAAFCADDHTLIEALTRGVVRTPLSDYRHIEYWIVRTEMSGDDARQAVSFANSCVGQKYGFVTDIGIALHFMTPGKGLWFGMDGTQICSGLVAQTQVRGWVIFPNEPSAMSPSALFEFYSKLMFYPTIEPIPPGRI